MNSGPFKSSWEQLSRELQKQNGLCVALLGAQRSPSWGMGQMMWMSKQHLDDDASLSAIHPVSFISTLKVNYSALNIGTSILEIIDKWARVKLTTTDRMCNIKKRSTFHGMHPQSPSLSYSPPLTQMHASLLINVTPISFCRECNHDCTSALSRYWLVSHETVHRGSLSRQAEVP